MWLCLSLSYFLIARSDEIFANSSGVAHPVHCLTREDVAFFSGNAQLEYVHWRQADKMEIQDHIEEVRARIRHEISGPQSGYRADGGAVALMVQLMYAMRRCPTTPHYPRTVLVVKSKCSTMARLCKHSER